MLDPEPIDPDDDPTRGKRGRQGRIGDTGRTGDMGRTGDTGASGDTGEYGDTGLQGEQGKQGEPGQDGVDGKTGQDGGTEVRTVLVDKDGRQGLFNLLALVLAMVVLSLLSVAYLLQATALSHLTKQSNKSGQIIDALNQDRMANDLFFGLVCQEILASPDPTPALAQVRAELSKNPVCAPRPIAVVKP